MSDTTTVPEGWPTRTLTSKAGWPYMGTVIEVSTQHGWERCRVVAKHGRSWVHGLEFPDGHRQPVDLDEADWRAV